MNFTAYAIGTEVGTAKNGTDQIAVRFRIHNEDADGRQGPRHGDSVVWYGFFTPAAEERTLESLKYCGWASDDLTDIAFLDEDACHRALPKYVQLVIENETYEGRTQEKVRWVNSLEENRSMVKQRASDSGVAALSARLRSKAAAIRAAAERKKDLPF